MPRSPRALLFDLDDTLYPQRRFVLSGFAAVARHVAIRHSIEPRRAFAALVGAYRGPGRGRELNQLVEIFGIPESVDGLVAVMRSHRPLLRLSWSTVETLRLLRRTWALGIVTNGMPAIQREKVRALGIEPLMDVIVYASEHGTGVGKPERAPFAAALNRLAVDASHAVFVGDTPSTDIAGAAMCGLATIQSRQWRVADVAVGVRPDGVVRHIVEVPAAARLMLSGRRRHHAA